MAEFESIAHSPVIASAPMPHLSEQDYQKVLILLENLYKLEFLNCFSQALSTCLSPLIPADITGYCEVSLTKNQFLDGTSLPEMASSQVKGIVDSYFHEHPILHYQAKTRDFSVCKLSDFVNKKQLHQMEGVYHQFLRPLGVTDHFTVACPDPESNTVMSVCLFREEWGFTDRDRTVLNLLQPHLIQARQTAQSFSQLMQEQQDLHDCLNTSGSVVIGKEGRIHWLTRKAEHLLKQYFPNFNYLGQTLPERLKQWVNYQRSLLSNHNGSLKPLTPLKIEQHDKLLDVRFAADPDKDQYILLLSEHRSPSLSIELLETLGLSTREAEVLFWVMEGKTNAEIASILYLSISTVRKHLEHIYLKLRVHTRAGAVVKAFRQLGVLNIDLSTNF